MTILTADDDPVSRRLTQAVLEKAGHQVVVANDGVKAWAALEQGSFDMAILDWQMPGLDGVTVCQQLRRRPTKGYVYVMLLTSRGDREDVVEGLDAGADEYLVKPINPEELCARVRSGGRILELERRLVRAQARLEMLATTDELTGLMNRRAVVACLQDAVVASRREGRPLSVAMMDLNGFKQTNDRYGHSAGDAALREFARRAASVLRATDVLARFGGDEFLLLLPGSSREEAIAVAKRVQTAASSSPVPVGRGESISLSVSFGVAQVLGDGEADIEGALEESDAALYEAKARRGAHQRVSPIEVGAKLVTKSGDA